MDEIEKNVRQQLLLSITGKNHITDEGRNLFVLPEKIGGLDLLSNTDFSRNNEWSRIENSVPEIAETEQTLIKRNSKTENQNITLSKKAKIMKNCSTKKTDNESSDTEKSIKLAKRATIKETIFPQQRWHTSEIWMRTTNTPHSSPFGQPLTLTQFLHCPKGGYTHLRHNENRDTFAKLLELLEQIAS